MAEELILGAENITTGASSDLEKATKFATQMVITYGMSEKVTKKTIILSVMRRGKQQQQALLLCIFNQLPCADRLQ